MKSKLIIKPLCNALWVWFGGFVVVVFFVLGFFSGCFFFDVWVLGNFVLFSLGFKENVTIWEALAKPYKTCGTVVCCGFWWGLGCRGFFRCKENKAVTSVPITHLCQVYYMLHSRVFTILVNHLTWYRSIL